MTNIEKNVMRRVHHIHILRSVFSGFTVGCVLLVATLYGLGREVWVARVFENMPHGDLIALSRFSLAAFDNTRLVVQALTLLTFASLLYLARETARLISSTFIHVRT